MSDSRPRLLVLGAGRHQVGLIRRAEERGIAVVVSDYLTDSPGKKIASHVAIDGDAIDPERNIEIARAYAINGVVTVGTDQAVPAVAAVASDLGLPCHLSPDGAQRATNKEAMKAAFAEHDVPTAASWVVRSGAELTTGLQDHLPVVVKPTDSQGQRATVIVDRPEDLEPAVTDAIANSRAGSAILETFMEGPEVTATAWVIDGVARLVAITDRVTYNSPPALGVCLQHVFPSRANAARGTTDAMRDICQRVAVAYGMNSGPLYVQAILTAAGPRVVEAAARVGGGHEMTLFPSVADFDLIDRSIDLALGYPIDEPSVEFGSPNDRHGLVLFIVAQPGVVESLTGMSGLVGELGVIDGDWYIGPGYEQAPIVNSLGRIGFLAITAGSVDELNTRTSSAHDRLFASTSSGENLVFWPADEHMLGPRIGLTGA